MKTILVKTDESKSYRFTSEALKDKGYKEIGKVVYLKNFKRVSTDLYEKAGELYAYKGMHHYNTSIYNVTLGRICTLSGEYEILENNN